MAPKQDQDHFTKGIQKASVWVAFAITLSGVVGNYYINNYKIGEHQITIAKIDERLSKVEKINYDLLVEQLKQIEATNRALDSKLTSTNGRIDEILKILIRDK